MLIYAIVCAHYLWMIKCIKENNCPENTLFLQGVAEPYLSFDECHQNFCSPLCLLWLKEISPGEQKGLYDVLKVFSS